jgi:hypothetical protein
MMDELINKVAEKTGLSPEEAKSAAGSRYLPGARCYRIRGGPVPVTLHANDFAPPWFIDP